MTSVYRFGLVMACAAIVGLAGSSAVAEDSVIFVPPSDTPATQDVGNWAVTANGNLTHFVFSIPDNFVAFKEALVIVLGKTTKAYTYDQNLSVASDGDHQAAMEFLILGTPDASITGVVHELDVSAILGLPALTAGMDYVSLDFSTFPANAVHVVGMVFKFTQALPADSVGSAQIIDGEVKTADLADGAVTMAKLADESVGLQNLKPDSVDSGKIQDGQVMTADLADGAVTMAKLADESVGLQNLKPDSVDSAKIQNGTIGRTELGTVFAVLVECDSSCLDAELVDICPPGSSPIAVNCDEFSTGLGASTPCGADNVCNTVTLNPSFNLPCDPTADLDAEVYCLVN